MSNIDVATQWIEGKDASYLCKEDKVVWFASITGRETDKEWQEMSLVQLQRVIKYTLVGDIEIKDIMSAFQELEKVYEMGVNSDFQTPIEIFNYNEHSPMDMAEKLIRELANFLSKQGTRGIRVRDLNICFNNMCRLTNIVISSQKRNRHYAKYFGLLDYVVRSGTNRVSIKGKKITAILHKNFGPDMIASPDKVYLKNIASLIVEKVKE